MNIVAPNLQAARRVTVALSLLTPPQWLPGGGGTKCCKNIDPATPPMITPEHTRGSTPVAMPVLVTSATGAAPAKSRRSDLQLFQ